MHPFHYSPLYPPLDASPYARFFQLELLNVAQTDAVSTYRLDQTSSEQTCIASTSCTRVYVHCKNGRSQMEWIGHVLRDNSQLNLPLYFSSMTPFGFSCWGIFFQKDVVAVMFSGCPSNQVKSKISDADWVAPMYTPTWVRSVAHTNKNKSNRAHKPHVRHLS